MFALDCPRWSDERQNASRRDLMQQIAYLLSGAPAFYLDVTTGMPVTADLMANSEVLPMKSWNYNLEEMVRLIVPGQDAEMMRLADDVVKVLRIQDQIVQRAALIVQDGKAVLNYDEISAVYRSADFPK